MKVRQGDDWIADSEDVLLRHEPGRYPVSDHPTGQCAAARTRCTEPCLVATDLVELAKQL